MYKLQVVVLDTTGDSEEWLDYNADEEYMEVCEVLTLDDKSPIPVSDLMLYGNWHILLVFERGRREEIARLLARSGIPEDRILYAYDFGGSLAPNLYLSSYLFQKHVKKLLRYCTFRRNNEKYAICEAEGMTYLNTAMDDVILPTMTQLDKNWSRWEMELLRDLAEKYYEFTEEQVYFCDIGANIGTTCLYFKKHVDPSVKIIAFEPIHENYKMLLANAILNDVDIQENRFVRKGLSDECTQSVMSYNKSNPGGSTLMSSEGDTDSIELTTFDTYLEENKINPKELKYLWIDVEGFEARFLKGASKTLDETNAAVYMEFSPCFYRKKEGEFELLMSEIGKHFKYFIFADSPEKEPVQVEELWKYQLEEEFQSDIFLIRDL